jgi:hypothetical protein
MRGRRVRAVILGLAFACEGATCTSSPVHADATPAIYPTGGERRVHPIACIPSTTGRCRLVISPGRRGVVDRDAPKGRASRLAPSPSISRARAAAVYYKLASTIHLSRAPGIPGPRRPSSTVPAGRGRAPAPRAVPGPATTSYRIPASSLARTTNLTRRCRRVRFVRIGSSN